MTPTVIVSPHFDDAVLSCWHLLAGAEEILVVNVFTGAPDNGHGAGWWDLMTGATNPAERVRERAAEDRAALAVAGREALALGFLDGQHRRQEQSVADIVIRLREALPAGAKVIAPIDLDGHPDHSLAREAAIAVRDDGHEVILYADVPGAIEFGWPNWVTGAEPDPLLDVDFAWRQSIEAAGLDPDSLEAEVHVLGETERKRKLEALELYRTQFAALDARRPLRDPEALRYEVTWRGV